MQARWYDPGSGRFLSVDPLIRSAATPQSANPYSYTENNPVNGVDPTGEWTLYVTRPDPNFAAPGEMSAFDRAVNNSNQAAAGGSGGGGAGAGNVGNVAAGNAPAANAATQPSGATNPAPNLVTSQSGGADPFKGVEEFTPVIGEGPASHSPAQLNSLFSGVEQFPAVTPNSFANFMNATMSGGLAMSASPASLPVRASPSSVQTLARNNAAFMSNLAPTSTTMALSGAAFLGIGLFALGAGLAVAGTGGLAVIPLGFFGATVTASAGGAAVLGTGFATIGFANLFTASVLRRQGR